MLERDRRRPGARRQPRQKLLTDDYFEAWCIWATLRSYGSNEG
ncbi:MAG: hypothetical protein ACLVJH_08360 [Faecalibacterium prausnitzii]